jgi:nucleoside diphosphate kinase
MWLRECLSKRFEELGYTEQYVSKSFYIINAVYRSHVKSIEDALKDKGLSYHIIEKGIHLLSKLIKNHYKQCENKTPKQLTEFLFHGQKDIPNAIKAWGF